MFESVVKDLPLKRGEHFCGKPVEKEVKKVEILGSIFLKNVIFGFSTTVEKRGVI